MKIYGGDKKLTTNITSEEIRHLALLCRVAMTDDEVELMRDQMSNILDAVGVLNRVDSAGVEPTAHSVDLVSVMREDTAEPSLPTEDILDIVPSRDDSFVKVRAVLE